MHQEAVLQLLSPLQRTTEGSRRRTRPKVVIIGGGFGGLHATRALAKAPVDVTLVDRRNFHLFQPLLYQAATGGLSIDNIAAPLRAILDRQANATVLMDELIDIDVTSQSVRLGDSQLSYDYLVLATGSTTSYFGNDHWERFAPALKTVEQATLIRRRVYEVFEAAEREVRSGKAQRVSFVVVGGGPTGVELAGALSEIARMTLKDQFRHFDPSAAEIVLIEGSPRILPHYDEQSSAAALEVLKRDGVKVLTGARVRDIRRDEVVYEQAGTLHCQASTATIWAAGVQASPVGRILAQRAGASLDPSGRVLVDERLSLPGRPEIFVIGDLAHARRKDGPPLPGVAAVAVQQGRFVGRLIAAGEAGRPLSAPFRYRERGSMAVIGRRHAVIESGRLRLRGSLAWVIWLFVHLLYLAGYGNRLLVLLQWAWSYLTFGRSARLITQHERASVSAPRLGLSVGFMDQSPSL